MTNYSIFVLTHTTVQVSPDEHPWLRPLPRTRRVHGCSGRCRIRLLDVVSLRGASLYTVVVSYEASGCPDPEFRETFFEIWAVAKFIESFRYLGVRELSA